MASARAFQEIPLMSFWATIFSVSDCRFIQVFPSLTSILERDLNSFCGHLVVEHARNSLGDGTEHESYSPIVRVPGYFPFSSNENTNTFLETHAMTMGRSKRLQLP